MLVLAARDGDTLNESDARLTAPNPRLLLKRVGAKVQREQGRKSYTMLMHNHPSGDPKPSRDDIEMTREIEVEAKALGIAIHRPPNDRPQGPCKLHEPRDCCRVSESVRAAPPPAAPACCLSGGLPIVRRCAIHPRK